MITATATTDRDESTLPALLQQMVEDLNHPQWYYWLKANYFDVLPPTERSITRWWQAPLFFDDDALRNPVFEVDALVIDVILKNKLPAEWERIRIDYSQIYSLMRYNKHRQPMSEEEYILYHNTDKLQMPPMHQEDV